MTPETNGIFYMLTNAGIIVKFILLLLFFFSITSWAIIFIKYKYIKKAYKESVDFTDVFWQCRNLSDAFSKAKALSSSPVARVFITGYTELKKYSKLNNNKEARDNKILSGNDFQVIESVKRALRRTINIEVRRLAQLISFLATAGNTAPFIGLFGTVWGIMDTFHGIGISGSASLAIVAPGISEALIATAAGLAVAIPSVMAYNYFTEKIRVLDSELQSFTADLLNLIELYIHKQREV